MMDWVFWLSGGLSALFILNGVANLIGLRPLLAEFARWGLPPWFRYFNALWQITTAVLLMLPQMMRAGIVMGLCVCAGIFLIVGVRAKEYAHCIPGIILTALLAVLWFAAA